MKMNKKMPKSNNWLLITFLLSIVLIVVLIFMFDKKILNKLVLKNRVEKFTDEETGIGGATETGGATGTGGATRTGGETGTVSSESTETFQSASEDTTPTNIVNCIIDLNQTTNHVVSKVSGSTYNIEKLENDNYLIFQKPYRTGENSHCFSVLNNKLYNAPKDINSDRQKWKIVSISTNEYKLVPFSESNKMSSGNYNVLQHDNGFLTLRPNSTYEGQKWHIYNGPAEPGIRSCALTPEEVHANLGLQSLNQQPNNELQLQYQSQLTNILNLIQSNLSHYQQKTNGLQTASSVFGRGEPLKLTLNVDNNSQNATEAFQDAKGNSVSDLLDKFEANEASSSGTLNYSTYDNTNVQSDLEKELGQIHSCKKINLNDYVRPRVGQCNCNISDIAI